MSVHDILSSRLLGASIKFIRNISMMYQEQGSKRNN